MAESAAPTADSPAERPAEGTGQRPITVVIADDQKMVRRGLRVILEAEPGISVVAEADDGAQAVESVRRHLPAVALLDIRMPVLDGLRAARQVIADSPGTRVLILTTFDADEYVYEALRAGASGFLLKDAPADQLVTAVRCLAAGDALIEPSHHPPAHLAVHTGRPRARGPPRRAAPAHRAGTGSPPPGGARSVQHRDRPGACGGGEHRQDPREPDLDEAGTARPSAGRGAGLRAGLRDPRGPPARTRREQP